MYLATILTLSWSNRDQQKNFLLTSMNVELGILYEAGYLAVYFAGGISCNIQMCSKDHHSWPPDVNIRIFHSEEVKKTVVTFWRTKQLIFSSYLI